MNYIVKGIFYTIQGEGVNAGRPVVFCRFAGCNLWSGWESDRSKAICRFCDTDFVDMGGQGGRFETAQELAEAIDSCWPTTSMKPGLKWIVCTGGEPLLQVDESAISALHDRGLCVAVETNGTIPVPAGIDWVCVSPKAATTLAVTEGDELKLVYPQADLAPESVADLDFAHFVLQPMDGHHLKRNTQLALAYCLHHPQWRLGLQIHKIVGVR